MAEGIDLTRLVGGAAPGTISNEEFNFRVLTDRDDAELNEYVQFEIIKVAKDASKVFPSGTERSEVMQAACLAATGVRWNSSEGSRILNSTLGSARIAWQMIKSSHKITFEKFNKLFSTGEFLDENIEEVWRLYSKLHLIEDKDKDKDEEKNKDNSDPK